MQWVCRIDAGVEPVPNSPAAIGYAGTIVSAQQPSRFTGKNSLKPGRLQLQIPAAQGLRFSRKYPVVRSALRKTPVT